MDKGSSWLRAVIVAGTVMVAPGAAMAGSFTIAPVRVELGPSKRTEALTVRNEEDRPVLIQLDVRAWSQVAGEDRLDETAEALATPPVFTLPARGQQVVRVALRRQPDPARELQYRLILTEVPAAAAADFSGLQVALRLSLPVFVRPSSAVAPALDWRAAWDEQGQLVLTARNSGTAHAQVTDFRLVDQGSGQPLAEGLESRYVLPGSERRWLLTPATAANHVRELQLHAETDRGTVTTTVPVAAR